MNNPQVDLLYAHNFIDFQAFEEPVKRGLFTMKVGTVHGKDTKIEIPIDVHSVTFNDELLNPITPEDSSYLFMSADKTKLKIG